jgi:Xaa-Pro aminopeptidase
MANDWNEVRYTLDQSANFVEIANSPWYTDAVYDQFSDAEFARRHTLAREKMAAAGFDALILTGSPNIYSLGGGVTWGSGLIDERGMCQYMLLPQVGEPTLIYPHPGCHIEAIRKLVAVRDVRGGQHGHFGYALADRLEELGLQAGRIGITATDRNGPEYIGVSTYQQLQERLPQATFVFHPTLLHELTYLKSDEELAAMARAGELAIGAVEAIQATARPGLREYQLEAAATHAVLDGGGRNHLMMIGSTSMHDPRLVFPNPRPSQRVLQDGDMILTEIAIAYKGYSAKIGQPVTIGPPTERVNRFFHEIVVPGFKAIQAQLKPGNSLEDVRRAGGYFRQHGAQSRPILMHGLDLITASPFIAVDQVRAQPFEMTIAPGMTFSIEITPIEADGIFGMFFCRSYAITEDGCRELTPYPLDEILVA